MGQLEDKLKLFIQDFIKNRITSDNHIEVNSMQYELYSLERVTVDRVLFEGDLLSEKPYIVGAEGRVRFFERLKDGHKSSNVSFTLRQLEIVFKDGDFVVINGSKVVLIFFNKDRTV